MRQSLAMPWSANHNLYSAPGRLVIKLALGEAPEHVPAAADVRAGVCQPADKMDGGPIDRIVRHFGQVGHFVRVHSAAASLGQRGRRHRKFDDIEIIVGLSRMFRVDTERDCNVADLVDALRQLSYVETAMPYYLCVLPFFEGERAGQSTLQTISLEEAWQPRDLIHAEQAMGYEPGDDAVVTALVDTGVLTDHPELQGRTRPGFDTVELGERDLAAGMKLVGDLGGDDADPHDEVGHGTSCAGIMSAQGTAMPPGLAGACGLLPIRVLGSAQSPGKTEPFGVGAIPDIDAGMKRAIDLGAKVINMSFGTAQSALSPNDPLPHTEVVAYGLQRGCILIAASGNSGQAEPFYPAAHEGVIAVAAAAQDGRPAAFSTTGPHVALCAPGERVVSAGLHGYQRVTGTSFAAPFVSATAALLVSRALRRSYPLDGATTLEVLKQSAKPWREPASGCGSGVLDAYAALQCLDKVIDGEQDGVNDMAGGP